MWTKCRVLDVTAGGAHSNHCALKCCRVSANNELELKWKKMAVSPFNVMSRKNRESRQSG